MRHIETIRTEQDMTNIGHDFDVQARPNTFAIQPEGNFGAANPS